MQKHFEIHVVLKIIHTCCEALEVPLNQKVYQRTLFPNLARPDFTPPSGLTFYSAPSALSLACRVQRRQAWSFWEPSSFHNEPGVAFPEKPNLLLGQLLPVRSLLALSIWWKKGARPT